MIPITVVEFGKAEEDAVLQVLRSGSIAQGPRVLELEERFADMVGTRHAVAVNNGTTALVAAIQALRLQPGDEIITSPFTFVATLNAILEAGATAVFADIDERDYNVTAASLEAAITPRTRALMPVHLYGQIADMEAISKLAADHGLALIEDTAQSHGSSQNGRGAGSFGIGTFSFYATKNITTGEGGMITTDDDVIADRIRVSRNQGMRERYVYEVAGHNYRMTDLHAALALPQLDRYDDLVRARRRNADVLTSGLGDLPGFVAPRELAGRHHVWHQYTARVGEEAPLDRIALGAALEAAGIGFGFYYPKLVFDYATYRNRDDVRITGYPVASRVVNEVISLPVHQHLTDDQLQQIIDAVRGAWS